MGATDSVMGAPEGLLSVFFITGFLLGTCLNEETCVGDACFNEGVLQLKIDRARTDTVSGLKYKERSKDLVAMVDVIGVCLPGANPNVLADSFSSCKNEKMEEVCTLAKRGWLENKEGKSVVKENALLATFGGIKGGEDAVRECLQIPEAHEYEYYEYDYADYYEEYDYLEESGRRQRRAAASNGDKEAKKGRKEERRGSKRGKTGRVESAIWGRVAKRGTSRNAKARSAKMKGGKKNKNRIKEQERQRKQKRKQRKKQIKEQERQRKQRKKPLSRKRRRLPNLTKTTKRRL